MEFEKTSMEAIATRIKKRRKELGYSYQDLADLTGMNKSSLQRYENGGISNIPLSRLQILASALQVSPSWLMGWSDAIEELNRYGYGIEAVANELNMPLSRLKEIMDSNEISDGELQEKFVRVAQLLIKELREVNFTISDTDPQVDAIMSKIKCLNAQGLERLNAYADDLVSSGKYKKGKNSKKC